MRYNLKQSIHSSDITDNKTLHGNLHGNWNYPWQPLSLLFTTGLFLVPLQTWPFVSLNHRGWGHFGQICVFSISASWWNSTSRGYKTIKHSVINTIVYNLLQLLFAFFLKHKIIIFNITFKLHNSMKDKVGFSFLDKIIKQIKIISRFSHFDGNWHQIC